MVKPYLHYCSWMRFLSSFPRRRGSRKIVDIYKNLINMNFSIQLNLTSESCSIFLMHENINIKGYNLFMKESFFVRHTLDSRLRGNDAWGMKSFQKVLRA